MNIVYNEILIYRNGKREYPNSNIAQYDVHPWHTGDYTNLKVIEDTYGIKFPYHIKGGEDPKFLELIELFRSQQIQVFLDHNYNRHKVYTLDEITNIRVNYIYPIVIYSNEIFKKYQTIDIPSKIIQDARNGNCKICFIQPTEGFFGEDDKNFIWLDRLSNKYELSSNSLIGISTNFIADQRKKSLEERGLIGKDSFKIIEYSYFQSNLWFTNPGHITDPNADRMAREKLQEFITHSLTERKTHHFLNFNRVPKLHRVILFGVLNSKDIFKDKFISTLGGADTDDKQFYKQWVEGQVPDVYEWKKDIVNFYENYDCRVHTWYDEPDLENNKANTFNTTAHKESFVNIVSESLIHHETVFFSEKTYKPMFCAQPFIMVGNPQSLKVLRKQGFKTFDKWWDESYDEELDFHKRMDKIIKVMETIASWDMDKCYKITQEMLPTLIHNFNILMKGESLYNLLDELEDFGDKESKTLI